MLRNLMSSDFDRSLFTYYWMLKNLPDPKAHAIKKLDKESNGYCPLCGYWSISSDVIIDSTGKKGDKCQNCDATFEASELTFIDSKMCKCGHPRNDHNKSYLYCEKSQKSGSCLCQKYEPTQVTITPFSQVGK